METLSLPVASQAPAQIGRKPQMKTDRLAWFLTILASFVSCYHTESGISPVNRFPVR